VRLVLKVVLVVLDLWVLKDFKVLLVLKDSKDLMVVKVFKVLKVFKVQPDFRGLKVPQVLLQVLLGLRELQVLVYKVPKVLKVPKELLGPTQ
jgi:hypothetical protein